MSARLFITSFGAWNQWRSQVELVGKIELLTVLLECLTVLLEYIDLSIPDTEHTELLERRFI